MKKMFRLTFLVSVIAAILLSLAACGDDDKKHVHLYGKWEIGKEATCTEDGEMVRECECGKKQTSIIDATSHTYGSDNECDICGEEKPCKHKNTETVEALPATCTKKGHTEYTICLDCNKELVKKKIITAPHTYNGGTCIYCYTECPHESESVVKGYPPSCQSQGLSNGVKCDECGMMTTEQTLIPSKGHTFVDSSCTVCGKTQTSILVQLYENDCGGELSSTLKRYCAGQDTAGTEEIDTLVRKRNAQACASAGVTVKYDYETSYSWGRSIENIQNLAKSGSASAPDIFANFVFDMTSCVLRGCFANLYANTDRTDTKYGSGENYFRFTKSDYVGVTPNQYFVSNAGEGYFYDYMQSLALVNENGVYDKLYCVASNYTIDAIRAMTVVPVNLEMLEGIRLEASTGDLDYDGDFDTEDFYGLVWNYDWTYDALAKLSKAVYRNDNTAIAGADIKDTLGFAVGRGSGLSGAGILYSSPIYIINKVTNADGTITYTYPSRNDDLVDLSDALFDLFSNRDYTGVCTISQYDVNAAGIGAKGDLDGIRKRFTENKILFGGVTVIGSLEDAVYQYMNQPGMKGFGIVPVPLYKQDKYHTEQYNTLIHNLARIFAISYNTTKFEECTVFLDYVSTSSAAVADTYAYNTLVAAGEAGEPADHNLEMFNFIKNHVRDCFDKTYDDIISDYQLECDPQAMSKRWHAILYMNSYMVNDMNIHYLENSPVKRALLETVLAEWKKIR